MKLLKYDALDRIGHLKYGSVLAKSCGIMTSLAAGSAHLKLSLTKSTTKQLYINCCGASSSLSPYLTSVFYMQSNLCMKKKPSKTYGMKNVTKQNVAADLCGAACVSWNFIACWSLFYFLCYSGGK